MRISGCDVVGVDLGTLIGVSDVDKGWIGACTAVWPGGCDVLHIQVVVGVGCLEPRSAVVQVEVNRVGLRETVVDAIEEVFLVAFVMENDELGRIEKAAGVEAVGLNEVAPGL